MIALGASGCGDDDNAEAGDEDSASSSTPAEKDDGLHAIVERSTLFDPVRAFAVRVRYDGDHDVQLGAIQFRSPLFEPAAPQRRDPIVRAGGDRRPGPWPGPVETCGPCLARARDCRCARSPVRKS